MSKEYDAFCERWEILTGQDQMVDKEDAMRQKARAFDIFMLGQCMAFDWMKERMNREHVEVSNEEANRNDCISADLRNKLLGR